MNEVQAKLTPPPPALPAATPHTDIRDVIATLRDRLEKYATGAERSPYADDARDAALVEYRRRLTAHIRGNLDFNIARLHELAAEAQAAIGWPAMEEPLIADLFGRVEAGRKFLAETDAYASSAIEEKSWLAIQQFYCDAIDLAERLLDLCAGRRKGWPRPLSDGTFKRRNLMGIESYHWLQTLVHAAEVAIPNIFAMRFRKTLWPTLRFMLYHQFWPWSDLHWADFEATTLGWLGRDGLCRLAGRSETRVRFEHQERATDAEYFDANTRRFTHNVIFAAAHRAGFLDFPFFTVLLRDAPHAVWANNAFYTPGMAKKLAKERTTIPIRGVGRMPMNDALDLTIRVFKDDGRALFIMADGSQPNLMVRHQNRVKHGIRVLVDECIRQTASAGRRTYVVPVTFDDPPAYLCGLDEEIVATVHPPILVTEPSTPERYQSAFDISKVNGGDDLLNQLEALYIVHSGQARHGLPTPDVVRATRAHRHAADPPTLRRWLSRRFDATVHDLSSNLG